MNATFDEAVSVSPTPAALIEQMTKIERDKNAFVLVEEGGFDIRKNAEKLQKFYMNLVK